MTAEPDWLDEFDQAVIDATRDAASRVLAEHGCMLHSLALCVDLIGADGDRAWIAGGPADQTHKETIALLEHGLAYHLEIRRLNFHGILRGIDDGE